MSHKSSPNNNTIVIKHMDDRYINRELSWLAFNNRVLDEAFNDQNPLMERVNFLAISASNLDEFYMVRVAGLKDYVLQGITKKSSDGLTPEEELELIQEQVKSMIVRQHTCWLELQILLAKQNITIADRAKISNKELDWLEEYFIENIFPVLTPIAVDPAHPFPFLPNLSLALVFNLENTTNKKEQISIIPVPARMPRFIKLPGIKQRYIMLEDMIILFLSTLMPNFIIKEHTLIRIIRDSELDLHDESDDFVRNFEYALKRRRRGRVIQIKFAGLASKNLLNFVTEQMHVEMQDVVQIDGMLGLSNLSDLIEKAPQSIKYSNFRVRFPERITDYDGNCFAAIAAKDIVIHHPYETFDVVVQFLNQAAKDPDVVSIKQTLYRTSSDSPVAKMLIAAAEAGKSVTALVELKARFDEEANIRWARDLEAAGVQVVYGFVNLKTHAKVTLVTRREQIGDSTTPKLVSYVHYGTGNYHPATAKVYTDLSFFTCDPDLCRDAAYLFNFVTGYAPPRAFEKIITAPKDMRKHLKACIKNEIALVKEGKPGAIWAKMNSLVDEKIIDALYEASQAGVQIELIIRGTCCLRPGVQGLSENIRVKSIVGRFLEHSRIFCFGNGHPMPSSHAKVYIGSADWMPRNFDRRVEVMVPIENPTVHEQILGQIMVANLKDEKQSWILLEDGSYVRLEHDSTSFCAHDYFINNPSLSGRGKALQRVKSSQMIKARVITKNPR